MHYFNSTNALMLLTFMAALAFAGCSNDDDLTTGGGKEPETGELRYLAVNIVTPNESTGRAALDDSFENGTDNEVAVNDALFILLKDEDGVTKVSQSVSVNGGDLKPWNDGSTGTVDKVSSAVLVVKPTEGATTMEKPSVTGILAVLNPTDAVRTAITNGMSSANGMTLEQVKAVINDYPADDTAGSFVMSNSAYVDGGEVKLAADVTDANLAKTEDAAKHNPVDIYVERVVAKIRTNAVDITEEGSFNQGASVKRDGDPESTALKIDIQGIEIANSAKKSYLFKNIEKYKTNAPFTNWTVPGSHRSYWATVPTLEKWGDYTNKSWATISGDKKLTDAHNFYAQENILDNDGANAGPGHTAVIVTAQLKDAAGKPFQLAKLAGVYYTPENALKQLAGYLNNRGYRVKTTETVDGENQTKYENLSETCLDWYEKAPSGATDVKGWEGFAKLKSDYVTGKTFAKWDAASNSYQVIEAAIINTALEDKDFRVWKWTDGKCYYFVDIEHFGTKTIGEGATAQTVNLKGIIRNHIYDLNLQSLQGLGVPVFDPTEEIIPEKPKDDNLFYLAARVNILQWKIVTQDVNFN